MNIAKILLLLGLATLMVGCNTDSSSDNTDDTDNAASELSLAKAFVQDFAGLQNSLLALEVPATEFTDQIENDLSTADEADAEAFALAFEAVMSQLASELETMITDEETGLRIEVVDVPDTNFVEDTDLGVTFSDTSVYSFTDTGVISAEGEATVGGINESVIFNLDLSLPEIDDQDTGSITYELNITINFTADTLILNANNASGTLKLELGDKTVAEFSENGLQGSELTLIEIGIEELSLDVGSLKFDGAGTLTINEFTQSDIYDEDFIPVFSIESQGKLTTSDGSYLDATMSLSGTFDYASYGGTSSSAGSGNVSPEESYSESEFSKANLSYSFTTTFKTEEHDLNVTAAGALSGEANSTEEWSEDSYSYTSQSSGYTEGGVTINHNGAEFIIDYEFDFNETNSQDSFDEQIDLLIQDATVTSHTVIIVLGDFDDVDTDAFEFGVVKVNGTRYGTLFNDGDATKAEFTDGSSVVVFDDY